MKHPRNFADIPSEKTRIPNGVLKTDILHSRLQHWWLRPSGTVSPST
uniref:Uncharacterized protein n=1 Tax=Arundo donax TaxID=35708 RepID=A0A0A9BHU7_ARUDO